MVGIEQVGFSLRFATVVVPVAVYFLFLGLLNSRRHPQLLTGRRDFILLVAALSPLGILPVLHYVGASLAAGAAAVALAGILLLLAPRGATWVIYNLPPDEARDLVVAVLGSLGLDAFAVPDGFRLADGGGNVQISGFPLLRNVSIRLHGVRKQLAGRFEAALCEALSAVRVETTPMAVSMLLIATAMMLVPLALVAPRVPEIVRILTDLLQ